MKQLAVYILLVLLSISALGQAPFNRQQSDEQKRQGFSGQGPVHFRPYPVARPDSNFNVYLLVEVMYDLLQFTLDNGQYKANFQMEIVFKNQDTKQVYSRIWESSFLLSGFEDTNRRDKFYFTVDSMIITPGNFDISYKYQDLQGKQELNGALKISLPQIGRAYAPAGIFLDPTYFEFQPFWLFKDKPLAQLKQIPFNHQLKFFSYVYLATDSVVQLTISISFPQKEKTLLKLDTSLTIDKQLGHVSINLPSLQWNEGQYSARTVFKTTRDSVIQINPFQIVWYDKPVSLRDPRYALEVMQVILPKEKYKELTSGNLEKQQARLREYWKSLDPTPATAFNEIENEFYTRVDSVDRVWGGRFRRYGWRTDPGKIILLYGQPGKIEDNSLQPANPNLIWTYYLPEKKLIFIFEAVDGRKRYKLIQQKEELTQ
jgi:GWxTD domain-containing protein